MMVRLMLVDTPAAALSAEELPLPVPGNEGMFASLEPPRRWTRFSCSLVLHLFLTWGVIYLAGVTQAAVTSLAPRYSLRLLHFPPGAAVPSSTRSTASRHTSAASPEGAGLGWPADNGAGAAANVPNPAVPPRQFQMPSLPAQAQSAQVLLQPELPPIIPPKSDIRLPELLIWKPIRPQPPVRKVFVAEKRSDFARARNLPAPPVLELPNGEPLLGDFPSTARPAKPAPSLPRIAATTAPIRMRGSSEEGAIPQIAPPSPIDSNPPNVVSVPEMPLPPAGTFRLPGGNQGGVSGSAAAGAAGHTGTQSALSIEGNGLEKKIDSHSPGHGAVVGAIPAPVGADSTSSAATGPVTKLVLPPDGHFAVMIESSGADDFEGTEGVLSGKVVHTVYVRVGAGKEWILEYCLPQAVERSMPLSGKHMPLEAPYPYLMLRPELTFAPDVDYLILHGIVTALGKFDQMTYVTEPEQQREKDQLLHALEQWQLRPGKLDGKPVSVEILLIIPSNRQ